VVHWLANDLTLHRWSVLSTLIKGKLQKTGDTMCSGVAISNLGEIGVREFARDSTCHLTVSLRSHAKGCTLLKSKESCVHGSCLASRNNSEWRSCVPFRVQHGVAGPNRPKPWPGHPNRGLTVTGQTHPVGAIAHSMLIQWVPAVFLCSSLTCFTS